MSRFSDTLMEHFQYPMNRGVMDSPDLIGTGSLSGHPPFVTLYLRSQGDSIATAMFEAEGCGVTIACCSMITELVQGRALMDCKHLSVDLLSAALGNIPPDKEYCAAVAIAALHDALRDKV